MADDIDLANDLIDNEVSRALNRFRESTSGKNGGATHCEECGDAIPTGRRQLGFKLCVPCAQEDERQRALFA